MKRRPIFLIGPMGAGKTSVGKKLAALLQTDFLDADQILEQRLQQTIYSIIQTSGEPYFRLQEQLLLAEVTHGSNLVLATGGGSILCKQTREYLSSRGIVCYLQVSPKQQLQRLQFDFTRPLLPSPAQRLEFFKQVLSQRDCLYASIADIILDTDHHDIDTLAQNLSHLVENYVTS